MLNQTGGTMHTASYYADVSDLTPIVLDDVLCTGSESSLNNCSYRQTGSNCVHVKDVGVTCGGGRQESGLCGVKFRACVASSEEVKQTVSRNKFCFCAQGHVL